MEMTVSVVEMMRMMIPMKSSSMTLTMATLREGISPAVFSLPETSFLSGVFRPAEATVSILDGLPHLRVSGR